MLVRNKRNKGWRVPAYSTVRVTRENHQNIELEFKCKGSWKLAACDGKICKAGYTCSMKLIIRSITGMRLTVRTCISSVLGCAVLLLSFFYVNVLIIATKLLLLGLCCNLAYYVAGVMFINLGFLCALTVPPTTTMMSTVEMLSTSPRK